MTALVRSEKDIILEGATQEKRRKTEKIGIGAEKTEGLPVTGEVYTQPQFPEDPQEGANGHNPKRNFLNLIEKWGFKVIAAGTAVNVITGRECRNCFNCGNSQLFKFVFKPKKANLEMGAHFSTIIKALIEFTRELKSTTTQTLYAALLIQGKCAYALMDSRSSESLVSCNFLSALGFSDALQVFK